MVTKHTESGRSYEIENGRYLIWHADVWEDEGEQPYDVRAPLRLKAGVLEKFKDVNDTDPSVVLELLDSMAPGQAKELRDLDINDLMSFFDAWNHEYELLNGSTPGEASSSSS